MNWIDGLFLFFTFLINFAFIKLLMDVIIGDDDDC